jgi:ABC-type transporter Mla MlaB component
MSFVTEYLSDGARLVLSGPTGAGEAAGLHAALVLLAATPGRVVIDESRVAEFDVTLLQLLLAFVRARRSVGRDTAVVVGPALARLAQLGLAADVAVA